MIYRIEHRTEYGYASPASLSYNDVCLHVRDCPWQRVLSQRWEVHPRPDYQRDRTDFFGNQWRLFAFEQPLTAMRLIITHEVDVRDPFPASTDWQNLAVPAAPVLSGPPVQSLDSGRLATMPETAPYLWQSPYVHTGTIFAGYGAASFPRGRPLLEGVMDLTLRIFRDFEYKPAATNISTTVEEIARNRQGVCQDFAHFAIAVLRSLGMPARYISGYLHTTPPPGREKIRGADASHAWISVYCPGHGWVDFDPTNGMLVRDGHITMAWGRDYGDVSPLKGVILGGGAQTLRVEVDVNRQNT